MYKWAVNSKVTNRRSYATESDRLLFIATALIDIDARVCACAKLNCRTRNLRSCIVAATRACAGRGQGLRMFSIIIVEKPINCARAFASYLYSGFDWFIFPAICLNQPEIWIHSIRYRIRKTKPVFGHFDWKTDLANVKGDDILISIGRKGAHRCTN